MRPAAATALGSKRTKCADDQIRLVSYNLLYETGQTSKFRQHHTRPTGKARVSPSREGGSLSKLAALDNDISAIDRAIRLLG